MIIYYQGNPGSYMQIASEYVANHLNTTIQDIIGLDTFEDVWSNIGDNALGVLAIENSYMGSIHHNIYNFLNYDYEIIGEYYLEIKHCLCSLEKDIKDVKEVYSQLPALDQCREYLKNKNIQQQPFSDTAGSAKYIQEKNLTGVGAICSLQAANRYGLHILDEDIADQKGNTTRFIVISKKNSQISYQKKSNKISMIFEAGDIPASLYKCLGAFATNNINLTKIESIPSYKENFKYYFWLDCEGIISEKNMRKALSELTFFTKNITILGSY